MIDIVFLFRFDGDAGGEFSLLCLLFCTGLQFDESDRFNGFILKGDEHILTLIVCRIFFGAGLL
jgi:hypothetical protein